MTVKCCRARRGFAANHMQSRARARESEVPVVGWLSMATRVMRQASSPNSPSHFPSKPGEPELPDTSDSDNQRPPGRLISIKMVRLHPYRTLPSTARNLEKNGRRAQEMGELGLEAWNIAMQKRRKRAAANILPCAGHWTILPAAGRRPECRQPGCL
jgi:hypothetical protein